MEKQGINYLREKILESRFLPVTEDLFSLYDEYEALADPKDPDDLAFLLCYKGEAYFRIGNFEHALSRLTRCIRAPKSSKFSHLDAISHNLVGLIYSFLGYEVTAFEHFKKCEEKCEAEHMTQELIACRLNIGALYRNMQDYETALTFYQSACDLIPEENASPFERLYLLALSYLGQTYSQLNDYDSMDKIYEKIHHLQNKHSFYSVAVYPFYLRYYLHKNDLASYHACVSSILEQAARKDDFTEFFEFYYDACQFLILHGEPDCAHKLIDCMKNVTEDASFAFLHYWIAQLEVKYAKKYASEEVYLEACSHFIELHQESHKNHIPVILHSMEHVELLHKTIQDSHLLEEKSRLDQMTGLFNKYSIEFLIREKLKSSPDAPLALLLVDMDYFKQINDKLGHLTGDSIIRNTAAIIKNFFAEDTLCGRVGGDEFLICVSDFTDTASILLQAELLRQEICRQTSLHHLPIPTDASIGIAFSTPDCLDFADLFHRADDALYSAKRAGRSKVITAD